MYAGSIVVHGTYLKKRRVLKNGIHFTNYQTNNKVYQYSNHVISIGLTLHLVKGPRMKLGPLINYILNIYSFI